MDFKDIREVGKDTLEARIYVRETADFCLSWIKETYPPRVFSGEKGSTFVAEEKLQQLTREWVDRAGKLMEKMWNLPELLSEDANFVISGIVDARKAAQKVIP